MPRPASASSVRTRIAALMLGTAAADDDAGDALGDIVLLPHQLDAVRRVRALLRRERGALLADETGLGKTFVALAVARGYGRALVVAPAALAHMWRDAGARAGCAIPFVSLERLSRRPLDALDGRTSCDLVIVDEAHHVRTPSTRRYQRLAALTLDAHVLLLSATPLHNRPRDLVALLALFIGERAYSLREHQLGPLVVRRRLADATPGASIPTAAAPLELVLPGDPAVLDALLALPSPVGAHDAGDGGVLLTLGLVRQWSSSDGALRAALRRRLARAAALEAALATGHHLSGAELRAWCVGDDAVQLAFPELLAPAAGDAAALLPAVREHARAVRALLHGPLGASTRDAQRAAQLRALRSAHPGEKIVAFTQFADTVLALRREMAGDSGVAALTGRGATVAGGALSRAEVLARFAPIALGRAPPADAERVTLLIASDLLSEGVNLQDACVVVHLDLPWTPARLEQRLGRVRRIGSRHQRVASYLCPPPVGAEVVLGLERALARKLRSAGRLVGVAGMILPSFGAAGVGSAGAPPGAPNPQSAPEAESALRRHLLAWRCVRADTAASDERCATRGGPLLAAVRAPRAAFLAAVYCQGEALLVSGVSGAAGLTLSLDARAACRVAAESGMGDVAVDADFRDRVLWELRLWLSRRAARTVLRLEPDGARRLQRAILARIAAATTRAPRHQRATIAALAARARLAATARYGAGAEAVLRLLVATPARGDARGDEAWLRTIAAFADAHGHDARAESAASTARVEAVLLLQSEAPG
ncbi:MAG TPA: DEAD/DEAH box helicase [Gemmatimonadaceae bacterium]|nr:DEAD/DEAH box helicase [Gemmatimonadaceae bacterium]